MSTGRVFNRDAYFRHSGRGEPIGVPLRVTAPHEWVVLLGVGAMLLVAVAWAFFGNMERRVTIPCMLAQPGELHEVPTDIGGGVVDVLVHPGDDVEVGQPIARIRDAELRLEVSVARTLLEVLGANSDERSMAALESARSELDDLERVLDAGEIVESPYAGVVSDQYLEEGDMVVPGLTVARIRTIARGDLEAIGLVGSDLGRRLQSGMEASVAVAGSAPGTTQTFGSEVRDVSPPLSSIPGWLAALPGEENAHQVRLALREAPPFHVRDGHDCNASISVYRGSPARVLWESGTDGGV